MIITLEIKEIQVDGQRAISMTTGGKGEVTPLENLYVKAIAFGIKAALTALESGAPGNVVEDWLTFKERPAPQQEGT